MSEEHNREIGQALQDARIEKGLSLDDIQQMTKIQKRYLQAIENGQFDQLPGKFYERAFVRQYAASVGLDADEFIKDHASDEDLKPVEPDFEGARVDTDNITRAGMHRETESPVDKTRQVMPKVLIAVAAVAIVLIVWALVSAFSGTSKSATNSSSVAVSSSKVESSSSSKKASSKPAPKPAPKQPAVKVGNGVVSGNTVTYNNIQAPKKEEVLQLAATSDAWLQVTDNAGTMLFNGTVKANAPQSIKVPATATNIKMQIGNANPLKVKFGNQDIDMKNNGATVWNANLMIKR